MNHTLPVSSKQVESKPIKSVCVFCGSANGASPEYMKEAKGGGSVGLMGEVARGVLDNGGSAIGIVPEPLYKYGSKQLAETVIVPDMHTRKKRMAEESDAFLVLPGGFGTMEEMLEMITWSQLNIHSKPIILINTNGYFKLFVEWIELSVKEGFVKDNSAGIFVTCDKSADVIEALNNYKAPISRYSLDWTQSPKSNDINQSLI
ncbi:hypothetical protein BDB01DRAFT_720520 [Pilobolus umbonatus]|nr:hypothetical protein BDB01DRAFT_720520 [Pilobolus umbonatus]